MCSSKATRRLLLSGLMSAVSPSSIREAARSHRDVEQELAHAVNASSKAMDRVYGKPRTAEVPVLFQPFSCGPLSPSGRLHRVCSGSSQGLSCSFVLEMVNNVRALRSETELLLAGKLALVSWGAAYCAHRGQPASAQDPRP